jgi:hypothetical protein
MHLEHAHAVRGLHELDGARMRVEPRLARVGRHARAAVTLEHELGAEILVVDADEAARSAPGGEREILDRVGIGAEAALLRVDRLGVEPARVGHATRVEVGRAPDEAVAPARHDVPPITVRDDESIASLRCDAAECVPMRCIRDARRTLRTRGEADGARGRQQFAARQPRAQHRVECWSIVHGRAC